MQQLQFLGEKLVVDDDLVVTEDTVFPAMNAPDSNKYLGLFEIN